MTARRPWRHDEAGSALVLALVFLSLFGLFISVLLSFADTGIRTTMSMRGHDARLYAADGAVDAAMLYVADEPARGREGEPCPDFTMNSTNDTTVVVECEPQTDSGAVLVGGGDNQKNKPEYAILTLPQAGDPPQGIYVKNLSDFPLGIVGDVHSNTNILIDGGAVEVEGRVTANGNCNGDLTATEGVTCPTPAAPVTDPGVGDPGYAPKLTARPTPDIGKAQLDTLRATCVPGTPVLMPTGTYTHAGALSNLMTCNTTFVFTGVYYFRFTDNTARTCGSTSGTNLWCVENTNAKIIGGTPDLASGECLAAGPGAQFIFGGDSRVSFQAGKVRICADPETTRQRIAIYAKSAPPLPPTVFSPETHPLLAGTAASTTTKVKGKDEPDFKDADFAKKIDGDSATASLVSEQTAALTLSSFTPQVPTGAKDISLRLLVNHREGPAASLNANETVVTLTKGSKRVSYVAEAGPGCKFCINTDTLRKTDTITVESTDFDEPDEINGASVEIRYTAAKIGAKGVNLDVKIGGAELEVTYTRATIPGAEPFPSQSGCVIKPGLTAPDSCALITTDGSNTDVRINGTIYAPNSAVDIKSVNKGSQIISRGLVSRILRVHVPASTVLDEPPIQIPPDSGGGFANRDVVFTAKIGGQPTLRARAEYDDAQDPPALTVRSWAVLQ